MHFGITVHEYHLVYVGSAHSASTKTNPITYSFPNCHNNSTKFDKETVQIIKTPKNMSAHKLVMDNPHEQVQVALLSRIINNIVSTRSNRQPPTSTNRQKSLNDSVHDMNLCLNEISNKNKDTEVLSQMWANYSQSADYNLDATGQKRDPL